ncbi:uncharacterized protein LOC106780287 isoform X2 [Vigna radiata var. radiata]|uniref:Uncharacterized protein LOC106780287 isoform X2 n=1 Tax=Vigna radiata var. radiata TaxID=3916 RepID=A0A1S3W0G5_VIGRR|nr:uncharacterized protein LOC106780287 isoform X2 [Vigna radiata var. radiata]
MNPVHPAPVPGSLNPTAVAAIAGALAQLVGNVDGLPRELSVPSQGRRGRRPFRGYYRDRFNHHHRGRGRGRGHGGQISSHFSQATIANVAEVPPTDGATSVIQPSTVSGQSSLPNVAQVPSAPLQAPQRKLWCEICKAECNTPKMLEQHKNGKRHRMNMIVHEELQRLKALNGQQCGNISTSESNLTIEHEKSQKYEIKRLPSENVGSEAIIDKHKDETELQSNVEGVSEVQTEEPQEESRENSFIQGGGIKRTMSVGRGGKFMRSEDGSKKLVEPPKPKHKPVTSIICELCNVKCDSQVVYNSHLTGKKHLSNFKRVHGYQALNGEAGITSFHSPGINALSNANNFAVQHANNFAVQQGVGVTPGIGDPRNLLAHLLVTVLSNVLVPPTEPLSGAVADQIQAPTFVGGSSHQATFQNLTEARVSDSMAYFETSKNHSGRTKGQIPSVTLQLGEDAGLSNNANTESVGGSSAKEVTVVKPPQDSAVITPAGNPVAINKQIPS